MENKAHALAAGAFVVFITALVVALSAWLARDNKIRDVYELSTRESVTGLSPQAAVRYRGIAVGKVDAIEFDPKVTGNVLVTLMIDSGVPITKSTFATLGFQGVTGLAYVQLDDDGKSTERLATGSGAPARLPLRQGLLSKFSDQGGAILTQVEETTKRLNLLLAPENQKVLIGAVRSAGQSADQVGAMSKRVETIMDAQLGPERTNIPALVGETTSAMKSLQSTANEINKVAQETTKAVASVNSLASKAIEKGGALDQVAQSTAAVANAANTFNNNTLPRTSRMADDTARSARSIEKTMSVVGENPQSLIFGNGGTPAGPGEPGFVAPGAR